ncbi:MAG: hypothetical protein ABSC95_06885 [Acetobacteraceae bacterium]|jgi:hypothetical protein
MTFPVCPCDGDDIAAPVNLPQLTHIAYRVGTYVDFRRAVLTPLAGEMTLSVNGVPVWRTDGAGDLAVMIAEWFAYTADILTFYNERIANQAYLRTADLPESVSHLIALLGYRPRPAIGATGTLAALVTAGQSAVLPKGLQFQSKPTPGQAPQTFELWADTPIGPPDQVPATPPPVLLAPVPERPKWFFSPYRSVARFIYPVVETKAVAVEVKAEAVEAKYEFVEAGIGAGVSLDEPATTTATAGAYNLILRGAVTSIDPTALLALRPRDPSLGAPLLATVQTATIAPTASGGQQTTLTITLSDTPPSGMTAAQAALETANQTATLWGFFAGAVSGASVHLASLVRQIRPGDWLLFTASGTSPAPLLAQVKATQDVIWDATGSKAHPDTPAVAGHPVPIPHTELTLETALSSAWESAAANVTVRFGWVSAGTLLNQPFASWSGTPTGLVASSAQEFPAGSGMPILLQDANGSGITASGGSDGDSNLLLGGLPDPVPSLQPPFLVLPNLLAVTRGKTIANEVLGSGDATNPGQDFKLSQSPVTYLQPGATWASTISLTVNGQPWTEVPSFYGQAANATVFVTYEDDSGSTHVQFGDGVNGARLPTGVNNVVATYRIGAGAASPPAGKLTVIAQSYPGLRAVLNPVAVGGGADPDPPAQISRYAPRSVLAFGRAVSVFDYQALAAQASGVTRASAVWAWNDARQRTMVTVYVGDDAAAAVSANAALAAAGDPNRPVQVVLATQIAVALVLTLVVTPGMDTNQITAGVVTALSDTEAGLFGSWNLGIGQPVFDSQIEAAVLAVPGAVAITAATFYADGTVDPLSLHNPGEGCVYMLDPADITLTPEPDTNGG